MSDAQEPNPSRWRPLTVRGVPLHVVVPAVIAVAGISMLVAGGLTAVLGAWILTIGFSLAVGAFVVDPRALAVPAVVWATWLLVTALAGDDSGLPNTPPGLALVLAGLGAVCVWLGQRAVQPAVEGARANGRSRALAPDLDALLEPVQTADTSPSLDPAAEVDEAIAELLLDGDERAEAGEVAVAGNDGKDAEPHGGDASEDEASEAEASEGSNSLAEAAPQGAGEEPAAMTDADDTGHVIEFAALSEDDLLDEDAPLPAATEAGRRRDGSSR